jgi:hypothetical protein
MIESAFALPYLLTSFSCRRFACSHSRRNRQAISLNAHFSRALPILLFGSLTRLPAGSCDHFIRRA